MTDRNCVSILWYNDTVWKRWNSEYYVYNNRVQRSGGGRGRRGGGGSASCRHREFSSRGLTASLFPGVNNNNSNSNNNTAAS